ncbi:exonuclease SbcCD subunit D [Planctomycetota bacterium]
MGRVRILQTGDVHLGREFKRLENLAAERQTELTKSFRNQIAFALNEENQIDLFLITGDLFDTYNPKPSLVGEVKGLFRRLAAGGIKIVLIPGTHDGYGYKDSVYKKYDFAPDAFVFTNQNPEPPLHLYMKGEDFFFYGFAFDPINSLDPLSHVRRIEADGIHIGIFHTSVVDRSDISIRKKDLPVSTDKLASYRFDYAALGHYHNYTAITDRNDRLIAAYAGSPEATKLSETGDRYFLVVEFENRKPRLIPHKSNIREISHFTVDVTGSQVLEDVFESCRGLCGDPSRIVHFELNGVPEFIIDQEQLKAMLQSQYFSVELSDYTDIVESNFVENIAKERATIRKLFLDELIERLDSSRNEREREQLNLAIKIGLDEFIRNSRG